jgi:hypothetical protein
MISRAVEISAGDWTFVVLTSFEKCIAMLTLTLPAIQQGTQLAADAPKDVEFIWKKEEERRLKKIRTRSLPESDILNQSS